MIYVEDLLEGDLAAAAQRASEGIPDIVAALDRLVPSVLSSCDLATVRRYNSYVDMAAQWLSNLQAHRPDALPPSFFMYEELRQRTAAVPWLAPSADGLGAITVLVDKLRGLAGGMPQECGRLRDDIEEYYFSRFCDALAHALQDVEHSQPLRRAMETLGLSKTDVAQLMGVTRQAVDKWLLAGPPSDRAAKFGAIAQIADLLRYHLLPGLPAEVARKPAEAYGGRTMLEVIADDEHEWLLQTTKDSFDFTRVA